MNITILKETSTTIPPLDFLPFNRQLPTSRTYMGLEIFLSIQRTRVQEGRDTWNFNKGTMANAALNAARHNQCGESSTEKLRCAVYQRMLDGTHEVIFSGKLLSVSLPRTPSPLLWSDTPFAATAIISQLALDDFMLEQAWGLLSMMKNVRSLLLTTSFRSCEGEVQIAEMEERKGE